MIRPTARIETRDGRPVVIAQGGDGSVLRAIVHIRGLQWDKRDYPPSGIWNPDGTESNEDLVEVPVPSLNR
jgi:hypothetical protein